MASLEAIKETFVPLPLLSLSIDGHFAYNGPKKKSEETHDNNSWNRNH